jgi:hypothetical protein
MALDGELEVSLNPPVFLFERGSFEASEMVSSF